MSYFNIIVSRHSAPSPAQLEKLVDFMETITWLATGHARTANARNRTREAWMEIGTALNCDSGRGCVKTWQRWCKYWKDKKGAIKRKASSIATARQQAGTGSEDVAELSEVEQRILTLMGENTDIGEKPLEVNHFQGPPNTEPVAKDTGEPYERVQIILQDETTEDNEAPQPDLTSVSVDVSFGAEDDPPPASPLPPGGCNGDAGGQQEGDISSPVRRRLTGRRRPLLSSAQPQRATKRRNLQRSPSSTHRSPMDILADRFIAIEEKRVEAEIITARSQQLNARGQQAMANSVAQLAQALSAHAQALNAFVTRINNNDNV